MGKKDITQKVLEANNDVFADIFNALLFGKDIIDKDLLEMGATSLVDESQMCRDVCRIYKKKALKILSLGIENQTKKDNLIPLRVMGYDYCEYIRQCKEKSSVAIPFLYPSITIVLNFSNTFWKKPTSLYECMSISNELLPYVNDYKVHIINMAFLSDDEIERLTSDFKMVSMILRDARNEKIIPENYNYILKHENDTLKMITAVLDDDRYEKAYREIKRENGKEEIKMCKAIDNLIEEGRVEGRIESTIDAIRNMLADGIKNDKIILYLNCTEEEIEKVKAELSM